MKKGTLNFPWKTFQLIAASIIALNISCKNTTKSNIDDNSLKAFERLGLLKHGDLDTQWYTFHAKTIDLLPRSLPGGYSFIDQDELGESLNVSLLFFDSSYEANPYEEPRMGIGYDYSNFLPPELLAENYFATALCYELWSDDPSDSIRFIYHNIKPTTIKNDSFFGVEFKISEDLLEGNNIDGCVIEISSLNKGKKHTIYNGHVKIFGGNGVYGLSTNQDTEGHKLKIVAPPINTSLE